MSMKKFACMFLLACVFVFPCFGEEGNLQEVLDFALRTPVLNTTPGPEYNLDALDYAMNCGIAQTPQGRLWACWIAGGDSPDAFCVCARSDDDGATWSEPCLVVDPPEAPNGCRVRCLIANFWTDPDGKLWFFFDIGLSGQDSRVGLWAAFCENPDAEEPTWSEPVRIANGAFHNKPWVTKDGTWILPVELYDRYYSQWSFAEVGAGFQGFPELDAERGITLLTSSDRGKSWQVRSRVVFPVSAGEEPVLLEKTDGRFWLLARTPLGMFQCLSSDEGHVWSAPCPAFANPVTRFCLIRLKSGRLLFIRHGSPAGEEKHRARLTACISEDDGKTWSDGLLLDTRPNVSYPDGFQNADGKIYITHDFDRGNVAEIVLSVFTEEDVLAGKLVSEGSRLGVVINKRSQK
ncbi:MAG: sialidase family protein [Planctomycetia bacterium]|nr:sialidase family protein [Planctomycetia bacterium]